jgi:hypothetical protein
VLALGEYGSGLELTYRPLDLLGVLLGYLLGLLFSGNQPCPT